MEASDNENAGTEEEKEVVIEHQIDSLQVVP